MQSFFDKISKIAYTYFDMIKKLKIALIYFFAFLILLVVPFFSVIFNNESSESIYNETKEYKEAFNQFPLLIDKHDFIEKRGSFSTYYGNSSDERKNNIELAVKSLNKTFIEVGGEFSFNNVVGERTEKRGYQNAKIINNGKFEDGVGGGVCQVSSTLYNAVLLADYKITEYHPHSLKVNYVEPSFDAMVNYYWADFKFLNNTKTPLIIYAKCDGERIYINIFGEKKDYDIIRKSVVLDQIEIDEPLIIKDEKGEYENLFLGDQKIISYKKAGIVSEGYLIKEKKGKKISEKLIRKDSYKPTQTIIVLGTKIKPREIE